MSSSGFVVTPDGDTALDLIGRYGVRYAASLDNKQGFAAFDAPEWSDVIELGLVGDVYMEAKGPRTAGPKRDPLKAGPKRKKPWGDERFALLAMTKPAADLLVEALEWEGSRGAIIVHSDLTPQVLVEYGAGSLLPWEASWQGIATAHRDIREAVAV